MVNYPAMLGLEEVVFLYACARLTIKNKVYQMQQIESQLVDRKQEQDRKKRWIL
jgi:hypothetical protein